MLLTEMTASYLQKLCRILSLEMDLRGQSHINNNIFIGNLFNIPKMEGFNNDYVVQNFLQVFCRNVLKKKNIYYTDAEFFAVILQEFSDEKNFYYTDTYS